MRYAVIILFCITLVILGWRALSPASPETQPMMPQQVQLPDEVSAEQATAIFAGGCFWCMEKPFETLPGVLTVESGYTGGTTENPTYEQVAHGNTGHLEAVRVTYDPRVTKYDELLEVFWRNVDPTDDGGQFVDRGDSYLTCIFVADEAQRIAAEKSKAQLDASARFKKPIVTPIRDAVEFYLAEAYHQDYCTRNPIQYGYYRMGSGRDQFIESIWGTDPNPVHDARETASTQDEPMTEQPYQRPPLEELREKLTPLQFEVTQNEETERPFENEFWDNKQPGIYVDIASGEPLFSSLDKYDSGCGWPSFTKPLVSDHITEKSDYKLFSPRIEVRSKYGDSHLGHVFPDGPAPTGLRYCINSASLRFIPLDQLESEGYGQYVALFEKEK